MPKEQVHAALKNSMSEYVFGLWYFTLRYIAPPALLVVMINLIGVMDAELIMPMFIVAYMITGIIAYGESLKQK
jgi:hypothetical protein